MWYQLPCQLLLSRPASSCLEDWLCGADGYYWLPVSSQCCSPGTLVGSFTSPTSGAHLSHVQSPPNSSLPPSFCVLWDLAVWGSWEAHRLPLGRANVLAVRLDRSGRLVTSS